MVLEQSHTKSQWEYGCIKWSLKSVMYSLVRLIMNSSLHIRTQHQYSLHKSEIWHPVSKDLQSIQHEHSMFSQQFLWFPVPDN
jgi:hypothetical protein